ncbi:MAG: septum formation initiator family protein [Atribacterota bacterium]|jgi:cell division protein FtsB|nr:septum formation initiator family protein [Atribacterota bacterium]MDD4896721.1 septum formation initiator family protein [Atribacterota bacterium]MDD5636582.1 septum formation initiator family protein [Atribacterota bacterium]
MSYLKSLLESKITWAIILLLIFYISFVFSEKYARILEIKSYITELEQEVHELEEDTKLLSEKIDLLNTNSYVEKIAREELDLVKPNEILYKSIKK